MTNNPTIDGVSREKFERSVLTVNKHADIEKRKDGNYQNPHTQSAWWGFKEATALNSELFEVAALQSTIAQLQARIGELEGWRGEPVAWRTKWLAEPLDNYDPSNQWIYSSFEIVEQNRQIVEPLYRRPAPPAVVLTNEERHFLKTICALPGSKLNGGSIWGDDGKSLWPRLEALGLIECVGSYKWRPTFDAVDLGINACLDATAALNGERK